MSTIYPVSSARLPNSPALRRLPLAGFEPVVPMLRLVHSAAADITLREDTGFALHPRRAELVPLATAALRRSVSPVVTPLVTPTRLHYATSPGFRQAAEHRMALNPLPFDMQITVTIRGIDGGIFGTDYTNSLDGGQFGETNPGSVDGGGFF